MSSGSSDGSAEALKNVLADYLRSVEQGQPLDQEQLVQQHAHLADELRSFFANRSELERVAQPLRRAADESTVGMAQRSPDGAVGSHVRYFGDYELLDEIARGGMGVVYKARQASLNRNVAVEDDSGRAVGRRFRRQAVSPGSQAATDGNKLGQSTNAKYDGSHCR